MIRALNVWIIKQEVFHASALEKKIIKSEKFWKVGKFLYVIVSFKKFVLTS